MLTGTRRGDVLSGGPSNDVLSGAAGADSLAGNEGADSLRGGPDTDAVAPLIPPPNQSQSPPMGAIFVFRFTYANRARTSALARVSCHTDRTETCAGVLTLSSLRGAVIAKGDFRVTRRGSPRVDLELTEAGSELIARQRRLDARASATMRIDRRSVPRAFAGDTVILAHGCKREEGCS